MEYDICSEKKKQEKDILKKLVANCKDYAQRDGPHVVPEGLRSKKNFPIGWDTANEPMDEYIAKM